MKYHEQIMQIHYMINENDMSLENLTRCRKYNYRCRHCSFHGANGTHLKTHLLAHEPGSRATPCIYCGWHILPSKMNQHIQARHHHRASAAAALLPQDPKPKGPKGAYYTCKKCSYRTETRIKFANHEQLHENLSGGVLCKVEGCGMLVSRRKLSWHKTFHHHPSKTNEKVEIPTSFECRHCSFKTEKAKGLQIHLKTHGTSRATPGKSCVDWTQSPNYTTFLKGNLKYYKCSLCPFEAREFIRFGDHLRVHEDKNVERAVCDICGCFMTRSGLHSHRLQMHGAATPKVDRKRKKKKELYYYKCPDCHSLSSTLREYRQHEKLHENEDEYEVCKKCRWLCQSLSSHEKGWHPQPPLKSRSEILPRKEMLMKKGENYDEEDEDIIPVQNIVPKMPLPSGPAKKPRPRCLGRKVKGIEKPSVCDECPFQTRGRREFQRHLQAHGEGCGGFPCGDCGMYIFPERYRIHRGMRHGEAEYKKAKTNRKSIVEKDISSSSEESDISNAELVETKIIHVGSDNDDDN